MKRKLPTILLSVLLLVPAGAWAQGPVDGGNGPFGGGLADPRDSGLRFLAQFLELDESQVEALLTMQSANEQALGLLARSIGENQRALHQALAADSPDEATVGRLIIEAGAIQREINLLRRSQLEAAPDVLNLSSGQREKLELLQDSLRLAPIAGIALRLNLIGGLTQAGIGPALPLGPVPGGVSPFISRSPSASLSRPGSPPAELEMMLESLQSEVERIGVNLDRVSQRLSIPPLPREQ